MQRVSHVSKHVPWLTYLSTSANTAALAKGARKAADIASYTTYNVSEMINNLEIRVRGGAADEERTGTLHFYGARLDDDICHIGDVAMTVGGQVATDGTLYIDTMVLTDRWITEVKLADELGNDGMSRLAFDTSGYDIVFAVVSYSGGSMTWHIDLSGFN